jgi:hypothetical protein
MIRRIAAAGVPASAIPLVARILDRPAGGGQATELALVGASEYASRLRTIPGWFNLTDFHLFDFVLGRQLKEDIAGDLLEIGSYQGKSTILLGYGPRHDEAVVVCDLFGAEPGETGSPIEGLGAYEGLTLKQFDANYDRFHSHRPVVNVCASSELSGRIVGREFRFLHIDGSHAYECVKDDIELAIGCSAPRAVLVLDDFRSPHTPGVASAVWEAVADGKLYPFCISASKLYATVSKDAADDWSQAAKRFGELNSGWEVEVHLVRDLNVVRLQYNTRHLLKV